MTKKKMSKARRAPDPPTPSLGERQGLLLAPVGTPPAVGGKPGGKRGRSRLTAQEREERREEKRLEKNKRQRDRRAAMKREREGAKGKLARLGVCKDSETRPGGITRAFEATPDDRVRVEMLAGLGHTHDEIALLVMNPATASPINEKTLRTHFARELEVGPVKATSNVAQSVYKRAIDLKAKGGITAAIFWLKSRAGWKDTQHVEVDTRSGVMVAPAAVSPEDWITAIQAANANKTEPGAEPGGSNES